MESTIIKLKKIHIRNIKNTKDGEITFSTNKNSNEVRSDIIGIYGQNGSGKTAMINSLDILKRVMSGSKLNKDIYYLINKDSNEASFVFEFLIGEFEKEISFIYEFTLVKTEKYGVSISSEKILYKTPLHERTNTLIESDNNELDPLRPVRKYRNFKSMNGKDKIIDLEVIKRLSFKNQNSFIFNDEVINLLESSFDKTELALIKLMKDYAKVNIIVISNEDHSVNISGNYFPFYFRISDGKVVNYGKLEVPYDTFNLNSESYRMLEIIIQQLNMVLVQLIPGFTIILNNLGEVTMENGIKGVRCELLSDKGDGDVLIPIKYESDGIKKIISILSSLVAMYNNESVLLAIDELDSAIFEYLLGEILEIFSESAKGQLIFTSHNLRPLEILNPSSIYFTTTNSENRYVQFRSVRETNNLRDLYYREVLLRSNTQHETLNEGIEIAKIRQSFRKAGKLFKGIEKNE